MRNDQVSYVREVIRDKQERLKESQKYLNKDTDNDAYCSIQSKIGALEEADDVIYASRPQDEKTPAG